MYLLGCTCSNISHTMSRLIARVNLPTQPNTSTTRLQQTFKRSLNHHIQQRSYNIMPSTSNQCSTTKRLITAHVQKRHFIFFSRNNNSNSGRIFGHFLHPKRSFRFAHTTTHSGGGLTERHKTVLMYLASAAVLTGGLSYAAVPLYRLYCQASGYGGTTKRVDNIGDVVGNMTRVDERQLTIRFEAGTNRTLQWKFKPQQKEVKLAPGETALAFYTAENLTEKPIIGIATYNVIPFDAGQYFNKIQCFCFEEQQLNPHEEVDMPVFFYIDPEFAEDPKMWKYDEIILSYTFFESNDLNAPVSVPHERR